MIITCPSCATRYGVDATVFPSEGRRVKCANCGKRWHAVGESELPEAVMPMSDPAQFSSNAEVADEPEAVTEDRGGIHANHADDALPDDIIVPDGFCWNRRV
jgi:predicted Zn finger-like uncharacterized protein